MLLSSFFSACNCNNHSSSCVFDASLYSSTGSGGRCIDCANNTAGPHCNECAPGYYAQANVSVSSVDYCKCKFIHLLDIYSFLFYFLFVPLATHNEYDSMNYVLKLSHTCNL